MTEVSEHAVSGSGKKRSRGQADRVLVDSQRQANQEF